MSDPRRIGFTDYGDRDRMVATVTVVGMARYQLDVRLEEHYCIERVYRADSLEELLRIGLAEVRAEGVFKDSVGGLCQAIRSAIYEAEDSGGMPAVAHRLYEVGKMPHLMQQLRCTREQAETLMAEAELT